MIQIFDCDDQALMWEGSVPDLLALARDTDDGPLLDVALSIDDGATAGFLICWPNGRPKMTVEVMA